MICARCHSDNVGELQMPLGYNIIFRKICNDCGYNIMIDDKLVIRALKLKKIMNG